MQICDDYAQEEHPFGFIFAFSYSNAIISERQNDLILGRTAIVPAA